MTSLARNKFHSFYSPGFYSSIHFAVAILQNPVFYSSTFKLELLIHTSVSFIKSILSVRTLLIVTIPSIRITPSPINAIFSQFSSVKTLSIAISSDSSTYRIISESKNHLQWISVGEGVWSWLRKKTDNWKLNKVERLLISINWIFYIFSLCNRIKVDQKNESSS